MSEILFLAHRVPFPPDRGDKIRSNAVLRALAKIAPVHVGCLAEGPDDLEHEAVLAEVAASCCVTPRGKSLARAGVEALARGLPVSLTAFHDRRLAEWVARTIATRPIAAIYVFSGQMGQYVPADWRGRLVVDLCDVDSAKFEAYGRGSKQPRRWIDAREGRLLSAVEGALAARADHCLLISPEEAGMLRARIGANHPGAQHIGVLPNGIDTAAFDPEIVSPAKPLAVEGVPHIVFSGQMDYAPNVAAAIRAAQRIMPAVRAHFPAARFHVVGRAPTEEVRRLDGVNGTRVWGAVPDVRPFLAAGTLALVPLEIARGVQNKVLEAMAMGLPVVATSGAATGLGQGARDCMAVADDDAGLAGRVIDLLSYPVRAQALGASARGYVIQNCGWAAALRDLPALMGFAPGAVRDAA